MKLLSLHIDNFGGLQNYDYNFSDTLNVILEDNGWGKSTMAAFLKAMLYGFDSKRSKDVRENERRRYFPWQGGKYGGTLDFEAGGKTYRIARSFGKTASLDKVRITDLVSKMEARISTDNIGEYFFKLDSGAFQRSVFINQNGINADLSAASSIHSRLNSLVSQANDVSAYDKAIDDLTQNIKIYEKTGGRGKIAEISGKILELEGKRKNLECTISEQDIARERIERISGYISSCSETLEKKKVELDSLSGKKKKQEAQKQLLSEIGIKLEKYKNQYRILLDELGGSVPDNNLIIKIQAEEKKCEELKNRAEKLKSEISASEQELAEAEAFYDNNIPELEKLNMIQDIDSRLNALNNTDQAKKAVFNRPESYETVDKAVKNNPAYPSEIRESIKQNKLSGLQEKSKLVLVELENAQRTWDSGRSEYKQINESCKNIQKELNTAYLGSDDEINRHIKLIEEISNIQLKLQSAESMAEKIRPSQESLILYNSSKRYSFDVNEANQCLENIRSSKSDKMKLSVLQGKKQNEESKLEILKREIEQAEKKQSADYVVNFEIPSKTVPVIMSAAGGVLAAGGMLSAILLSNIILWAVAAAGAVVTVLGILGIVKYKQKYQEYNDNIQKQNAELERIKKEISKLRDELNSQEKLCQDTDSQISELTTRIDSARKSTDSWLSVWIPDINDITEEQLSGIIESRARAQHIEKDIKNFEQQTESINVLRAEISSKTADIISVYPNFSLTECDALKEKLRDNINRRKLLTSQLSDKEKQKEAVLSVLKCTPDDIETDNYPKITELQKKLQETENEKAEVLKRYFELLSIIDISATEENVSEKLRDADLIINAYNNYNDKIREQDEMSRNTAESREKLSAELSEKLKGLGNRFSDRPVSERIALVRDDIIKIKGIREKTDLLKKQFEDNQQNSINSRKTIIDFINKYCKFSTDSDDKVKDIITKASECAELRNKISPLEEQKKNIENDESYNASEESQEETTVKNEIAELEIRKEQFIVEYTKNEEAIRNADSAIEQYPKLNAEIREMYREKQKAQTTVASLKKTIQLISKAKENLANRYLSKVEQLFNSYLYIWLNNKDIRGIIDIDFNVSVSENDNEHVAENYSSGYCDLIDFCMRFALIDTLFENESPFLILDDPFVNLDPDRLNKALELLDAMSSAKQIIYFVCHPIRAIDKSDESAAKNEYAELAAMTKQAIEDRKTATGVTALSSKKSLRDYYNISVSDGSAEIVPENPDYVIRNNIFSLKFKLADNVLVRDRIYELFFIDSVGHVLNERKIIEVSDGQLSAEKIQFCLNTRDDSGNSFELMIREPQQDDYDVICRIPFKADLAFTSSFDF